MKTTLDIPSYLILVMNFIVMDKILLSIFLVINIPKVFFIKSTNNDRSIIWNQNVLAMGAQVADCMHTLLLLFMHFTIGGPPHGEEYKSYLIHNMEHFNKTFY
jgi:hypothetical protein